MTFATKSARTDSSGTSRVDGGYLGQTGPDTLNARLSQDDPKRASAVGAA
jgi:hypothetical protein